MIIDVKENYFRKYTDEETFKKIINYPTVVDMWKHCVEEYAEDFAIQDGEKYTYAKLEDDASKFRGVLANAGIQKGDKVGVVIPSSYDFAKVFIALATYGAVAVLMPVQLDERTIFGCSQKFGCKAVIYADSLEAKMTIAKAMNVPTIKASEVAEGVGMAEVLAEDPCVVMFTGGTTGRSKGALLTHKAVMAGVVNGCYGTKDVFKQRYFLILPLTHVFGLIRSFLTALYTGSLVYICRDLKNMFKEMAVYSPSILIMVPALAEMALNLSKQIGRHILGQNLKTIICGASAVPPFLIREYDKIGVQMLAGYGLTESANLVSGNGESLRKPESVGLPYPNQQLKIVNGELWIKGDNLMTCYVGEEEENKNAFEDGWFKTGDLVRIDEEGFLYIVGRIKEVIVLESGENVSPAEIEDKFLALDFIADAMVSEDFDEFGKQSLLLEVVPRVGFNVPEEQMRAEINEINSKLLSYQRVTKVVIRDKDFDRTPAMKKIRKVTKHD